LSQTIQIAEGVAYLHGLDPPVVHGDIKGVCTIMFSQCANILISDDFHCCLADFGLCILDTQSVSPTQSTTFQGSLRWLAPEFINPSSSSRPIQGKLTSKDIYAFGCTMCELLTGEPPFSHYAMDISVAIDVLHGVRPILPMDAILVEPAFHSISELLNSCWSEQILKRPEAVSIPHTLRSILDILAGVHKAEVVSV
ncbi:kinase-like domain-containing protein, partial [Lentinula raphanica]